MRVKIGDLRNVISIEERSTSKNGFNEVEGTWAEIGKDFASIKSIGADEREIERRVEGTLTHRILMRYRPDITDSHRFKFKDRIFNIIKCIDLDERNEYLIIDCGEVL